MKTHRQNRRFDRGSVTLTWESAAATVLVLVGFGGVKYLTATADCSQLQASQWVACSNVLDSSCQTVVPVACQPDVSAPAPIPCGNLNVSKSHSTAKSAATNSDNRSVAPPVAPAQESASSSSSTAPDTQEVAEPIDPDSEGAIPADPVDPCA